jgi:dUTPase
MAIPEGHYGRIAPRSGLAAKHHIDTGAGVIDSDYRGPLKVLLFNLGQTDYEGMYFIECSVSLDVDCVILF